MYIVAGCETRRIHNTPNMQYTDLYSLDLRSRVASNCARLLTVHQGLVTRTWSTLLPPLLEIPPAMTRLSEQRSAKK